MNTRMGLGRSSGAEALLRMIEHKAPLLMKAGSLVRLNSESRPRSTPEEREEIKAMLWNGLKPAAIAKAKNRSYDFVIRITRPYRKAA
jgi:hypothetical protein